MALAAIGAKATGESPSTDEGSDALNTLYLLLRSWRAKNFMLYYVVSENFTLTAGTQSYTIGSGGDFDTVRPVRIEGAFIRDSNSSDIPLKQIGPDEYRNIAYKTIGNDTPARFYYDPDFPLGVIYFFPPGGGTFYVDSLKQLSEPTAISSSVSFPPEYDNCIKWNLALHLAPEYAAPGTHMPIIIELARDSLHDLISLNAALRHEPVKLEILRLTRRYNINENW